MIPSIASGFRSVIFLLSIIVFCEVNKKWLCFLATIISYVKKISAVLISRFMREENFSAIPQRKFAENEWSAQ